ncbi:MAG: DUF177 domain-containing protein [Sphingomonas bacterium]|nr:DUF177 domain-containing protein [Sphingomonas bacterium]
MSESFACRLNLDKVHDGARIDLVATDAECADLARRLGLVALDRLAAHCVLDRKRIGDKAGSIRARGRIKASLSQACVASGEPLPAYIDEAFELHFQPEPTRAPDEEVELSGDELDVIFHDGSGLELGEAIADTLAVSIDPYPRGPNAEVALSQAGVLSEDQAGPFAALAALKGKMGEE